MLKDYETLLNPSAMLEALDNKFLTEMPTLKILKHVRKYINIQARPASCRGSTEYLW